MKTLYLIRREDWFTALGKGQIPDDSIREFGTVWISILLTPEQKQAYSYPISNA